MKKWIPLVLSAMMLVGCADTGSTRAASRASWEDAATNELIASSYRAADVLIAQARPNLDGARPLLAATIVNINALEESSPLGRMLTEQVSAQFSHNGFSMVEMKFRDHVYVKQNVGELLLTREIKQVAQNHNAQAVIVGTYTESDQLVFVNLKVIRPVDNIVLAAHDYAIPVNKTVRSLLGRR